MTDHIPYKPLNKPLKLIFDAEVNERKAHDSQSVHKVTYVNILPVKSSFWSADQLVEVTREAAPVNHFAGNNADALVQHIARALYQLRLKVNFKGMPAAIDQQDQLWQKWLHLRQLIADTYTGDWVNEVLTKVDQKMLPSAGLINTVMQDVFFNNYFRDIYDARFSNGICKIQRPVYGLTPDAIPMNETWELKQSDQKYHVKFSGSWTGHITEVQNNWFKVKNRRNTIGTPQITGSGSFYIEKETGWCSSFENTYAITTEYDYEKIITTTLRSA
jgi:hypothetical protein